MNKKLLTAIFITVIICAMLAFAGCTTDDDPDVTDPSNGTDMGETTDQNSEFTFSQQSDGSYVVTGLSYNYDGSAEIAIPSQYNGEPVTSIGDRAFSDCTGLTSITIPDSVTSIGDRAFYNCNALTTITIPDGVTSIGDRAFYNCNALTTITIPDGVTSIGDRAFENCYGLTSVTIPDSVTSIGEGAFFRSTMIETATMPTLAIGSIPKDSLKTLTITSGESIAEQAFYNCRNLTNITISDSVTSIGSSAFYGCTGLTSIIIPDSVTIIGDSTFFGCSGLTSITIPDRVTSIGVSAFSGCSGLTSVTIPDSVIAIGDDAFNGCSSIETATVPALALDYISKSNLITLVITSGESIDYFSLSWCNNLTSITIPDSVTSIGSYAFSGCSGLTSITIPDSVTSISSYAFNGCSGLTSITVEEGNEIYHSAGNCLIETKSKTLTLGCKNSVIPADGSLTSIGSYAFEGCSGLTSITIPDSVTSIGSSAFSGCSGLTRITFQGTMQQWKGISKGGSWDYNTANYTVTCTDGVVDKNGRQIS